MDSGAFNAKKATLSLDLKGSDGGLSLSSPAKSPLDSVLGLGNNMEITAAQKQYAQGFFDALRSVHNLHNFEFDNKKAPFSPGYLVPAIVGNTDLASPFASTPTSSRDLQAIIQAMVGTPLGQAPATTVTGFPNAFSSILPGPSTTSTVPSTSSSTVSLEAAVQGLRAEVKQEASDDSQDTMSEVSRSSSAALGLSSSTVSSSTRFHNGMSLDEQERRKLERKRARNRAAASKCRQKKMDRINELEQQVQSEKVRSQMLDNELIRLRTALNQLESVFQRHRQGGCSTAQC